MKPIITLFMLLSFITPSFVQSMDKETETKHTPELSGSSQATHTIASASALDPETVATNPTVDEYISYEKAQKKLNKMLKKRFKGEEGYSTIKQSINTIFENEYAPSAVIMVGNELYLNRKQFKKFVKKQIQKQTPTDTKQAAEIGSTSHSSSSSIMSPEYNISAVNVSYSSNTISEGNSCATNALSTSIVDDILFKDTYTAQDCEQELNSPFKQSAQNDISSNNSQNKETKHVAEFNYGDTDTTVSYWENEIDRMITEKQHKSKKTQASSWRNYFDIMVAKRPNNPKSEETTSDYDFYKTMLTSQYEKHKNYTEALDALFALNLSGELNDSNFKKVELHYFPAEAKHAAEKKINTEKGNSRASEGYDFYKAVLFSKYKDHSNLRPAIEELLVLKMSNTITTKGFEQIEKKYFSTELKHVAEKKENAEIKIVQETTNQEEIPLPSLLKSSDYTHVAISHMKITQQKENSCGHHAVANAWAIQELFKANAKIDKRAIDEITGAIGSSTMSEIADITGFCEGLAIRNVYFQKYDNTQGIQPAGQLLDDQDLDTTIKSFKSNPTGLIFFICHTQVHWILVAVIKKENGKPQMLYLDSKNEPLTENSIGVKHIESIAKRLK